MGQALGGPVSEFHSGPFDCAQDWPSFLESCFCPWCTMGFIVGTLKSRIGGRGSARGGGYFDFGQCCISAMLTPFCCMGVTIFSCQVNKQIKHRYNIRVGNGSRGSNDECCYETLCYGPNLSRIIREMGMRSEHPGGVCSKPPARTFESDLAAQNAGLLQAVTLQRRLVAPGQPVYAGNQVMMMQQQQQPPQQQAMYYQPPAPVAQPYMHHHHHHHQQHQQMYFTQPQQQQQAHHHHHHHHHHQMQYQQMQYVVQ